MLVCILESIHGHKDLLQLDEKQRQQLCQEIREFLIDRVSRTGGHVASNLGVVELTVALETVFDTDIDRLVFDVGHQSYIHKLLTDRQADFSGLRQYGGMAGFPKPAESHTDAFVAGHASSSVSIALGMARARTLTKSDYHVVALIGDGSATGGMAFEGLNDAAVSGEPLIVILNDNAMSIDRNVGGMASHLRLLRTKQRYLGMKESYKKFISKIPGGGFIFRATRSVKDWMRRMLIPTTMFEAMGFTYLGPVDGHDTENLIELLQIAKDMKRPVLLHVVTQKGKGYTPAQLEPRLYHGIGQFDPVSGKPLKTSSETFSDVFGATMCQLAAENDRLCAITAAMPTGTGLVPFKEKYPARLFDVGIAEEHAVSMAGGLAKQGMVPVVALYSTFLQRSYDMILQDICMLHLHAVLAIDRAGLVGDDGETHHGVFDVGFLRHAPGMRVLCPGSKAELPPMLRWAVMEQSGPVAIRYPRGGDREYTGCAWDGQCFVHCHQEGKDAAIVVYGSMLQNAMDAAKILEDKGISVKILRLMQVNPLPVEEVEHMLGNVCNVVIAEETAAGCGIGDSLVQKLSAGNPARKIQCMDLGDKFVPHGTVQKLYVHCHLDGQSIADKVWEESGHEK